MNVDCDSPAQYWESESMTLVKEVNDMKQLTGIMPEPLTRLTLTISLKECPRETNNRWEGTTLEEDRTATRNPTMTQESEVARIRNKEFMNLRCLGSVRNNKLEDQTQTQAVTRQEISLTSFKEIPSLSKDGLDAPQTLQEDYDILRLKFIFFINQNVLLMCVVAMHVSMCQTVQY
jgi:hypothetical protein